ncbi:MAG: nucleotidyltransferase domain-containing protein [Caldilineales bacterium]|nr:nucleotidyltransferase domain-containing protein [Caldilineales bacterium]MDW8319354.1 nucleotidyltransferase domain-containing protein [Anaerolineae bacterium]
MSAFDFPDLQQQIAAMAGQQAQVRLVYLFGSQVSGTTGPLSDVDLAVLLTEDAPVAQCRAHLEHLFSTALDGQRVDLVILNRAPIELAYAVIAQGKLLYQCSLAERVEYEATVMSLYGDYLPFLEAQRQDILKGARHERRVQRYREALGRTQQELWRRTA